MLFGAKGKTDCNIPETKVAILFQNYPQIYEQLIVVSSEVQSSGF
jgi:hypothetical protein